MALVEVAASDRLASGLPRSRTSTRWPRLLAAGTGSAGALLRGVVGGAGAGTLLSGPAAGDRPPSRYAHRPGLGASARGHWSGVAAAVEAPRPRAAGRSRLPRHGSTPTALGLGPAQRSIRQLAPPWRARAGPAERMVPFGADGAPCGLSRIALGAAGVPRHARALAGRGRARSEALWLVGVRPGCRRAAHGRRRDACYGLLAAPERPWPSCRRRRMMQLRFLREARVGLSPPTRGRRGLACTLRRARQSDSARRPVPARVRSIRSHARRTRRRRRARGAASVKMVLDGSLQACCRRPTRPGRASEPSGAATSTCASSTCGSQEWRHRGAGAAQAPRCRPGGGPRHRRPDRAHRGGGDEARRLRLPDEKPFAVGRPAERGQSRARAARPPTGRCGISATSSRATRGSIGWSVGLPRCVACTRSSARSPTPQRDRAHHRANRAPARADRARDPPARRNRRDRPFVARELRGIAGGAHSSRSCSVTSGARSRARTRGSSASSRWRTPGRSSWTRSERSGSTFSRSSCGPSRNGRSSGSEAAGPSDRRPDRRRHQRRSYGRRWRPAGSGRTCSTASTWCRSPVPPLRDRREDVAPLTGTFWRSTRGSSPSGDGPVAGRSAALERYHWPGNVRGSRTSWRAPSRSPGSRSFSSARFRSTCALAPAEATAEDQLNLREARHESGAAASSCALSTGPAATGRSPRAPGDAPEHAAREARSSSGSARPSRAAAQPASNS